MRIAQSVGRSLSMREVAGSNPVRAEFLNVFFQVDTKKYFHRLTLNVQFLGKVTKDIYC